MNGRPASIEALQVITRVPGWKRRLALGGAATMPTEAKVMTIPARYENGVFRPLEVVAIEDGTLVEVRVPAGAEPVRKRRSIKDLPFYGMWADRDDIIDGVNYVNALRNNPRG
jgi:predicted DNA-binding antitoxin AbrB/MazE fold protein